MCGLFITNDKETLPLLMKYNSKRGDVNASLQETLITGDKSKTIVYIGHHHAPTSTNAKEHPSKLEFKYTGFDVTSKLWHNGIVKQNCIEELQKENNEKSNWDTKLIHLELEKSVETLSNIDGSFALVYSIHYSNQNENTSSVYVMRNLLSPLFSNKEKTIISSAKVPELDVVYKVDPHQMFAYYPLTGLDVKNCIGQTFKTCNNPYNIK